MPQPIEEQVFVAEEILEVRYSPRGSFLPQMGNIADYIKDKQMFPHWQINTNTISFKDAAESPEKIHAFMSHKNAGFVAQDSPTRNFFSDKSSQFWRALEENPYFKIPDITRIGVRNKCFIALEDSFEDIEASMSGYFLKPQIIGLMAMGRKDIQVVLNFESDGVGLNASFGPMHKGEAERIFPFKSKHFSRAGIFIDLDWSIEKKSIRSKDVMGFIKKSSADSWIKIEQVTTALGV